MQGSSGDWLVGGGQMGELVRAKDWSKTPLGAIQSWPQSLRTAVSLCLSSTFPMNIIWGPQSTQIYNDGYRVVCGDVHPRALGEDYRITWASAWPAIGDSFDRAWAGERMFLENQRMFLKRLNGSELEETFFTFSHSPIQDESGRVGGLFHPVTETTANMLAERRTRALRDLAASLAVATDEIEVARQTVEALARFDFDLPLILYYLFDQKIGCYRLVAHHGIKPGATPAPPNIARDDTFPWPFAEALGSASIIEVDDLRSSILQGVTCGPYQEPPNLGFVIPIVAPAAENAPAVIVTGASSRLPLNADYRSFYDLLGVTIAGALSTVRAREDERRRAEALAEIDRAKTAFFSNVSHEFRTPLTLMLGPLEEAKAAFERPGATQFETQLQQIDLAHRNALRLLKLVNTLLDFSRIEAGRAQASYEPIDLGTATAELASVFRSAVEKAGLQLKVDCPPLSEPIYVDRDMWEKIVLNLISNAFKFTFEGEIEVKLRERDRQVHLIVRDTGTGIPAGELPKLFDRFHRVEGARGRTHEGSGIGLALVQELVKLHAGSVAVDSVLAQGSRFSVTIPMGHSHLPAARIGAVRELTSTAHGAAPFVEEALRWLPDAGAAVERTVGDMDASNPMDHNGGKRARIILADDNADMRDYVRRLLAVRYDVEAVGDGEAALQAIARDKPDLVLSDIMMPGLDGVQLLARLRADPRSSTVPVIFLSARAGEESRIEGMQAGADDYLIKPFSARELLARVESTLKLARVRAEASHELRAREERYRDLVEQTPDGIFVANTEGRFVDVNPAGCDMLRMTREEVLDSAIYDALAPEEHYRLAAEIARFDDGSIVRSEWRMRRKDGSAFDAEIVGRRLPNGNLQGIVRDVTEHRRREIELRQSEARFRMLADNISQLAWTCDRLGEVTWYNRRWLDYTGLSFEEMKSWGWKQVHHPDHVDRVVASVTRSRESGEPWEDVFPLRSKDGEYRWFLSRAVPIRNAAGELVQWFGTNTDITEQRQAEETQKLLTSELNHRVKNMLATVQAIANQTLRHNGDPARFVTSFGGRLQSMSRMHSMLSSSDWRGADLLDIIRDQLLLGPVDESRVTAWGPAVRLEPHLAPQVAIMLHELGTNSIKYGALSNADGIVAIEWLVHDEMLRLRWIERGGPEVSAPVRRGFGTALIEQSARGTGGSAQMSIEADGVQWEILLPLPRPDAARESTGPASMTESGATILRGEADNADGPAQLLAGKRFLVIEDEPLVALDIISSLEQAGVTVAGSAGSTSEALSLIERTAPDAVLLDANLHGQPVGDIAAALTRRNVPFIFVTGYGRESLPPAFTGAAVLPKPFNKQNLLEAAAKLVQKPASVRKLRG